MAQLCSVSIDLDAVDCYWRIHALPGSPPDPTRHLILRRCLPRFAQLFASLDIRATFFVVGRDLDDDEEGRRLLAQLAENGHELASHSYSHPYNLVRLPHVRIAAEIDQAHQALIRHCSVTPQGFRAPGYGISGEVLQILVERNYRYDSSAFPSVPYYLAKAAVMGGLRLLGRRSSSLLDSPAVLGAPRSPYRPDGQHPYRPGPLPIVEMPMAVTRWLRLPVIGTSLIAVPEPVRRWLVDAALGQPFFNLELHGIDLADAAADGFPPALVARQPDLRLPLSRKWQALEATLRQAIDTGGTFLPLREAATRF